MLQRIYGTAFFDKKALQEHLTRIEEAKKRDHRKLGKELDLFHFHPYAPGSAFWTPKGTALYQTLSNWMRRLTSERRLRGDQDAAAVQQGALGDQRPLGQVQGEHVPGARQRDRRARLLAQADELPLAPPVLRLQEAQLPRPAAALPHPGRAAPQRGRGLAGRPHPRAPVRPGRRAHLLHGEPDRRRGPPLRRAPGSRLQRRGPEVLGQVLHPPGAAPRRRRHVGSRGGGARGRAQDAQRARTR